MVLRLVAIRLPVANQGDEESELRDLDGDGLDVDAVKTILDEVELAGVVDIVFGEITADLLDLLPATQKSLICSASDKMQLPGTQYSSATTLKLLVKILRRQTLQKDPTILNRCRSLNLG